MVSCIYNISRIFTPLFFLPVLSFHTTVIYVLSVLYFRKHSTLLLSYEGLLASLVLPSLTNSFLLVSKLW